jgi:hypothetical protein
MERIVFIADYFAGELNGGSEQSFQAIIDACPYPYVKIPTKQLKLSQISKNDLLIFGNFFYLTPDLIQELSHYTYVIIESDFKFCHYRSPTIHHLTEGVECNCYHSAEGMALFNFYLEAVHIFWKSAKQRDIYEGLYPPIASVPNTILSATFTPADLILLERLSHTDKNGKYAIIKNDLKVKNSEFNKKICEEQNLPFIELGKMPRKDFLRELAKCKGLVYYPLGEDTCPRITIEAKLLGCELILGDYCLHKDEPWFSLDKDNMIKYLLRQPQLFWETVL